MQSAVPTRLKLESETSLTRDVFLRRVGPPILVHFLPHSSQLRIPIPIIFQRARQLARFCSQKVEFASFFAACRRGHSQRGGALKQAFTIQFRSVHREVRRASVRECLIHLLYLVQLVGSLVYLGRLCFLVARDGFEHGRDEAAQLIYFRRSQQSL